MTLVRDPGADGQAEPMDDAVSYIHRRPYVHFVVSEIQAGLASLSVYGFFLLFSFVVEKLTELLPLKHAEPAHFLDLVFAWGAAFSGAFTFVIYTIANAARLVRHAWRQDLK